MKKGTAIKLFNYNKVRVQWDEKTEKWYFSVIDFFQIEIPEFIFDKNDKRGMYDVQKSFSIFWAIHG